MTKEVLVLGAGIIGLSTAIHLRRRGISTVLVDNGTLESGASFGNGGVIQREAVFPYAFPRDMGELLRIAINRSIDVSYHPLALFALAPALLRYWYNSAPHRYAAIVANEARLIATCVDEHLDLAREAQASDLLRRIGWIRCFSRERDLDFALTRAETARREFGVSFDHLDADGLANAEPSLQVRRIGAIHWTNAWSLSDPGALLEAYAVLYKKLGGVTVRGDAARLERAGAGWRLPVAGDEDGLTARNVEGTDVVIALGAASTKVTRRFGYKPPLFGKRGYHMHYGIHPEAVLNRPLLDTESGFLLAPMSRGVRLTTGAEFAQESAGPTPVQLARAEPIAKKLLPLTDRVDTMPWMGIRPCMPDMIPVIGPAPTVERLWCGFGHGHQGMTLGPTTGRLLAELIAGEQPFLDPAPYRADRF